MSIVNILCAFIIACPIFDVMSYVFRNYMNTNFSISTFLRPIIPMCILAIIFLKGKKKEKIFWFVVAAVYILYGIIHLFVTKTMITGASYGTVKDEVQYIFNYTFLIIYLIMYVRIFVQKEKILEYSKLQKSITIMSFIYIISILFAIVIGKSSYTYIETQTGYKGWIESGNSLSAILLLSLFIMFPMCTSKELSNKFRIFTIGTITLTSIYLMLVIGTRTGLFGTFIAAGLFVVLEMIYSKNKKAIICGIVLIVCAGSFVGIKGSTTIKRRKQMAQSATTIIDEKTGEIGTMTGDMLRIKNKILDGTMEDGYMSEAQQKATMELYNYSVKHHLAGNDTRTQQLMYNIFLVKNQKSVLGFLFGNGFKTNFREMVMENELASMLLNFGLIGFILYVMPLITILGYSLFVGIKNIKKTNVMYLMMQAGLTLALGLSWMSGYVLFATSSMMVIVILSTMLLKKALEINNSNIDFDKVKC